MILQNWWYTTLLGIDEPMCPPLRGDIEADVVIVGAGAAGLSAAYALKDTGLKVVVLERNICGGSSSGKSAGFLTPDSELELSQLIRRFGKQGARDLWSVATRGVELMAQRIQEHAIPCDLQVQDSLFLGLGESGWKDVQEEVTSRESLGFQQECLTQSELAGVIGSSSYSGGVRYGGTYGVDALMYCQGMKRVLLDHGIQIFEASEVLKLEDHRATTHLGSVRAAQILVCADKLPRSLTPYADNAYHAQTFLSISEPLSDTEVQAIFPSGRFQCWDSELVYSYFRLTGDNRMLLGGGDMLTTFSKNDIHSAWVIDKVIRKFHHRIPAGRSVKFVQFWPGRIDTTRDLLPTIVHEPEHPWLHLVLGCVGLPWATFCGDFVARQATNDPTASDDHLYHYYRPDRRFLIPIWMERVLTKKVVFSLNNGWAKYYQHDVSKES